MVKIQLQFKIPPILVSLVFVLSACSDDEMPSLIFPGVFQVEENWMIDSPELCSDGFSVCYETTSRDHQYLLTIEESDVEGYDFRLTGMEFQDVLHAETVDTLANSIGFLQLSIEHSYGLFTMRNDTLFLEISSSKPTGLKFSELTTISGFGLKQ